MNKKVIIIGGVAGGATTAARLRRLDESIEIIILERGEYISYANCGLPYYIGDVIKERSALLLQTPEVMKSRFNVDVRTSNEAISIDKEQKKVIVKNIKTQEEYVENYDTLVIATGSSPLKPSIPGIEGPGIHTLWTIPDTDEIKTFIEQKKPKRAAVIGGGFIGLEMAENLHAAGCKVTIVEMQNQVMPPIDFEMAQILHENIDMNDVNLSLGDGVKSFSHNNEVTTIHLNSGKSIEAELVILSIGVTPNSKLAKDAGLALNERNGIIVDGFLRTSDQNIYAVGDVIEVENFVSKNSAMVPLAGPANKQARICAGNIFNKFHGASNQMKEYKGTQGTSVAKVFDLTVATTGLSEKILIKAGKEVNKDYFVAIINQKSHAGYYPGATPLTLKLLFSPLGEIFGSQIVGIDGVDKRIDVIATTQRLGGTIYDLCELELAYAPPYSSAKDPVNMLGFVAENILNGMASFTSWDEIEKKDANEQIILDVGEDFERMAFEMPNSVNIPLGQLRNHLSELDKNKLIIPYCAIGVRSYNAARILMNSGFKNVKIYPGGTSLYKSVFYENNKREALEDHNSLKDEPEIGLGENKMDLNNIVAKQVLDCSGLQCPGPIMRVFNTVKEIEDGDIIQVSATDMGFVRDIDAWCRRTGNTLLKSERKGKENIVYIQKGTNTNGNMSDLKACSSNVPSGNMSMPQGKTLIVFSGDLDKVLASFIIANGAAALGRPVTMFFTFWGLNALRKSEKQSVKKPIIDNLFGTMMPRGTTKLSLSKMHMGGMGTKMMKKVMKDKNIDSLEDLMKHAMANGVKLIACTMSMDVMGITKEELIDGVEFAGVAAYLGDAEESNVNLFI
ncbi:MAG: FAD-dependent oxidoreductase [Anaerotignaceae bacterium]